MMEVDDDEGVSSDASTTQEDNACMILSDDERRWSLAIKQAVEATADLTNLTDMQYAQHALVDKEDTEAALHRIRHMQYFREEYEINDTVEQGVELFEGLLQQQPGVILSVSFNFLEGNYVVVYDRAAFDQSKFRDPNAWRCVAGGVYYMMAAVTPDLHAIRSGAVHMGECEGMDWKKLSVDTLRRIWSELIVPYPIYHKEINLFHTTFVANVTYGMMKPFLPESITSRIHLGCRYEGNLKQLFLQPNLEVASERTLMRFEAFLKRKSENQRQFRLH